MRSISSAVGAAIAMAGGIVLAARVMQLSYAGRQPPGPGPYHGSARCPECDELGIPLDIDALEYECADHGPFTWTPPANEDHLNG